MAVTLFDEEFKALLECEGLLRTIASKYWHLLDPDLLKQVGKVIETRNLQEGKNEE